MPPNVVFSSAATEAPDPPVSRGRKRWHGVAVVTVLLMTGGVAANSRLGDTTRTSSTEIESAVLPMADDGAFELAAEPAFPGLIGTPADSTTSPKTTVPSPSPAAPTMAVATDVETTATLDCHPAYLACIPNHRGDALNCGDLSSSVKPVRLRDSSRDPYRLDSNGDGIGCDTG